MVGLPLDAPLACSHYSSYFFLTNNYSIISLYTPSLLKKKKTKLGSIVCWKRILISWDFEKREKKYILIEKGKRVRVMSFGELTFLLMGGDRHEFWSFNCPLSSQCPAVVLRLPLHLDR